MIWIIWLAFIVVDALLNHWWIKSNIKVRHGINGLYRLAIASTIAVSFHLRGLELLMFGLGGFFSFWLLFNFLLNRMNGWAWDYLGSTAILDRLESTAPIFWVWVKLVCVAGFVYGFYHIELL